MSTVVREIGSFDIPYRPASFEFGYSIMSGYDGPLEDRTIVWDLGEWDGVVPQYLAVDRPDWIGTSGLFMRPPENWLDDVVSEPFAGRVEAFQLNPRLDGSVQVSILTGAFHGVPEPSSLAMVLALIGAALFRCLACRRRR